MSRSGDHKTDQSPKYTITPEQARCRSYCARLREEIVSGETMTLEELKVRRIENPLITAYKNRLVGGDGLCTYDSWLDPLLQRFGKLKYERCLSVGAGRGRVEQHLVEVGLCSNFDAFDVNTDGGAEFSDLNFATLQANTYDFILCHGALHHLINLEHVLDQINGALKPDGIVVIYEYVGERQWQFSTGRIDRLRELIPGVSFTPPPRWTINGFESVRSDELLRVIKSVFSSNCHFSQNFGAVYFPFITCTGTAVHDHLMGDVLEFDGREEQQMSQPPCYHVGVYGKTSDATENPRPWTDIELETRLHRSFPIKIRVANALRSSPAGPLLRSVKRFIVPRA
jgi:SAM-dependent methyltransferase